MNYLIIIFLLLLNYCKSQDAPKLGPMAQFPMLNQGSNFAAMCLVTRGSPPFSFFWSKNGHMIYSDYAYQFKIEDDDYKSILNIDSVGLGHAGNYTCTVRNNYGEDHQSVMLNVLSTNGELMVPQQVPPYLRSIVIIPFSIAIMIIAVACGLAFGYVKYEERKFEAIKAGLINSSNQAKNFQYFSGNSFSSSQGTPLHSGRQSVVSEEGTVTIRYHDSSDKTKPLLARPPIPTVLWAHQQEPILEENEEDPYSTLPFQNLSSFKSPNFQLQNDNCKRLSHDERVSHSLLFHTPPKQSLNNCQSGNVLCKADIHSHNQDSCDEFFRPHHV